MQIIAKGKRSSRAVSTCLPIPIKVSDWEVGKVLLSSWASGMSCPVMCPAGPSMLPAVVLPQRPAPWLCHWSNTAFLVPCCFAGLRCRTGMSIPWLDMLFEGDPVPEFCALGWGWVGRCGLDDHVPGQSPAPFQACLPPQTEASLCQPGVMGTGSGLAKREHLDFSVPGGQGPQRAASQPQVTPRPQRMSSLTGQFLGPVR